MIQSTIFYRKLFFYSKIEDELKSNAHKYNIVNEADEEKHRLVSKLISQKLVL